MLGGIQGGETGEAKESEEWASTRPTTRVRIRVLSVMEVDGKFLKKIEGGIHRIRHGRCLSFFVHVFF